MNNSIIFYDATTKLINPFDEVFINKKLVEIFIDYDKPIDEVLTNFINENLVNQEYNNIIIPVCFGKVLADFLGLRLAIHIRCTPGLNQHKNIFLYSFTGLQDYFLSESFNILKTHGVFLIDYDVNTIINKTVVEDIYLSKEMLISEIKKLELQIPLNYEDNHSIANEWAIYKWSQTINTNDEDIAKIESKLQNDLYFKYLKTIYPIQTSDTLKSENLRINFEGNPKILFIDDEAEKGWYDIFCKIFNDENGIHFRHLDDEFNEKSKDEIIDISLTTIINDKVDLVILDFRLHKKDFENNSIENITGYQILKKIKEYNKGIQVIVFSATNKIWNLQALQEAGADSFIIKESPENSTDSNFTTNSVLNLVNNIENRLGMIFLKKTYSILEQIKSHLATISNQNNGLGIDEGLMKMKFKNEIYIQLDIIYDCLKKSSEKISTVINDDSSYLNLSFTSIFKIIELINDYYTDEKGIVIKSNKTIIQRYNQQDNSFIKISKSHPSTRDKIYSIIKFELNGEPKKYVNKLNQWINFRNNITHPETLKDYKKTTKQENLDFLELLSDIIFKIK